MQLIKTNLTCQNSVIMQRQLKNYDKITDEKWAELAEEH